MSSYLVFRCHGLNIRAFSFTVGCTEEFHCCGGQRTCLDSSFPSHDLFFTVTDDGVMQNAGMVLEVRTGIQNLLLS